MQVLGLAWCHAIEKVRCVLRTSPENIRMCIGRLRCTVDQCTCPPRLQLYISVSRALSLESGSSHTHYHIQTSKQTNKQTNKQTHTHTHTDRDRDRQTDRHTQNYLRANTGAYTRRHMRTCPRIHHIHVCMNSCVRAYIHFHG